MKCLLYFLVNVLAAAAIVLLIDPARPLTPTLCLLRLALACVVHPAFVLE
jgi:hypothetical protein